MNINEKLNRFLKTKESHACLVFGPWGVGKTYAVETWLSTLKNDELFKDYKVIRLPLFGVSHINDLNAMALKEEGLKNRFVSWLKNLNQNLNVGVGPVSVGMPLIGMVATLLKENHSERKKLLFVIDDIERKDNTLTIEEVLGFIDSLPADNTKVILIANLDKFSEREGEAFNGFKEKVIQDEYIFRSPQEEAIVSIIGKRYAKHFLNNEFPIKNLRTLIKIKKILSYINGDIDCNLLECIYYCCLNICEMRLGKKDLEEAYYKNKYDLARFSESIGNGKADKRKIEEETALFVNGIKSEPGYIYENAKLLNLLNGIKENSLKLFIEDVYTIILEEEYDKFASLIVPKRDVPLKIYEEHGSKVFYSKNPNDEYKLVMENFKTFFKSNEYNLLKLLNNFYLTVGFCNDFVSARSEGKMIEKQIMKECPKLVASYIFNNATTEEEEMREPIFIAYDKGWVFDNEKEIVEAYIEVFNEHYTKEARFNRLNKEEFEKRLYVIDRIFPSAKRLNVFPFKMDEIMTNAIQHMEAMLKEDLTDGSWDYCHAIVRWISNNKDNYALKKTIQAINLKASKMTLAGHRFSVLVKQFGLKENANG